MKIFNLLSFSFLISFTFFANLANAQTSPASEYMNAITAQLDHVQADMWAYTNAMSHNKNARKIEKKRLEIIETVKSAKQHIWSLKSFKGDNALKDSAYTYLKISLAVLTEDYSKLVDMEEIAEQSYDRMEAYLLAKEIAYKKQDTSFKMLAHSYQVFAAANNINLLENRSKIVQNLDAAGKVFDYHNKIYLIFFKSFKQEAYVLEAMNKNDVSALKQNTSALVKTSNEGITKLDTEKSFESDGSLKGVCKETLQFFKNEAETKFPVASDFLVKKETFEKIKKSIDAKGSKRTPEDIEAFNTASKDYNAAVTTFNTTIQKINGDRARLIAKWNETSSTFIDRHVPSNN